jgi:hypothetical protein
VPPFGLGNTLKSLANRCELHGKSRHNDHHRSHLTEEARCPN